MSDARISLIQEMVKAGAVGILALLLGAIIWSQHQMDVNDSIRIQGLIEKLIEQCGLKQ